MRNHSLRVAKLTLAACVGFILWVVASAHDARGATAPEMHPPEAMALQVRALQSDLMVGALTCDLREAYNATVMRFRAEFVRHGHQLRAYFDRAYGAHGPLELDRMVTQLANRSAARAVNLGTDYCSEAKGLFADMLELAPARLATFAAHRSTTARNEQAALAR